MVSATLAIKVRMFFERGKDIQYIYQKLQEEGYALKDIKAAVKEYIKDEQTNYDDRLIEVIEDRFRTGKRLDVIFDELVKEGHPPFEIEKALLRAFKTSPVIHPSLFVWKEYTIHMFLLLIANLIAGYFISHLFYITALLLLVYYGSSSLVKQKKKNYWTTEIEVLPFVGIWVTTGFFGYNNRIGNYFRWWIFDPAFLMLIPYFFYALDGFLSSDFWFTAVAISFFVWSFYIWGIPENEKPF